MANQISGNQTQDKSKTDSTSRADQPTPVSQSSQSQGTQSPRDEIKQAGRTLADEAKNAASSATREVKGQASDMSQAAQEQATHFLGEQKGMAAERIEGVAQALRHAGQELAEQDEGKLAHYTDSFAGQLDNFSNTLRNRDIGSLMDDAKQLAHRQPEMFVAGALAAGFVLGRFFKSSSRPSRSPAHSDESSYGEYDPRDPSRYYGQQYGEPYRQEFGRGYAGPAYERGYSQDYDAGYRSGYQSEYGSPYNQSAGSQYGQSQSAQNYTQQQGQQLHQGQKQGQGQEFGQGEEQVPGREAANPTREPNSQRPETRDKGGSV